jgi:hypothetical protein
MTSYVFLTTRNQYNVKHVSNLFNSHIDNAVTELKKSTQ